MLTAPQRCKGVEKFGLYMTLYITQVMDHDKSQNAFILSLPYVCLFYQRQPYNSAACASNNDNCHID